MAYHHSSANRKIAIGLSAKNVKHVNEVANLVVPMSASSATMGGHQPAFLESLATASP
jgi:hypothetical protein